MIIGMEQPETVDYQGVTYKRKPDSDEWSKRVYYQAPRGSGRGYLHRDIYSDLHGSIPKGMQVHHADHDPFNNDPTNLVLLTPKEHRQEHARKFDEERMEIFRRTTLAAAAEWHGSEEGIAWHREHGKQTWANRTASSFTCPECGAAHEGHFPERSGPERYCSGRCRQRGDAKNGKYREEAICPICSEPFMRMRGKTGAATCSRPCGRKLMSQRIAERRKLNRGS